MKLDRGRLTLFLQLNPALMILLGLLNGIIPYYYFSYENLNYAPFFSLIFLVFLFLFLKIFILSFCYKNLAKCAIFTLLGWYVSYNAFIPSKDNYIYKIPRSNCAGEIKAVACDTNDPSGQISWMPKPKYIMAEVVSLRISQESGWQKSSGKIYIDLPKESLTPEYGNVFLFKGAFFDPEGPVFEGDFDFKKYLMAKGVRNIFTADSIEPVAAGDSYTFPLMSDVLHLRNYILDRMTIGMSINNRRMLAAVMFGCRQGLDYKNKKNFLKSGVIHIFAVSGLHVGLLALTLYILLRWVPFQCRYLVVPFLLLIYVFTTGMQPSALRALFMISMWSFIKGFLFRTSSLNIVFMAASFMLMINPFSLLTAGFQFSFTIAFFLVLAWDSVSLWSSLMHEKFHWIPSDRVVFKDLLFKRIRTMIFNSFTTSLIAWLSGSVLLFFHRSFFIPGAVFTNFIIIPLVWLLFSVTLLNLLIIPFHSIFSLNPVMDILLNMIRYVSLSGAEWGGGGNIVTPPVSLLLLFFVFLFFFIVSQKKFGFLFFPAAIFLIITFCCFSRNFENSKVVVFHGGESQTPAVISIPSGVNRGVVVLDPGSNRRARAILSYLNRNGVNSIDNIFFSENRKASCEGAWYLMSELDVKHVVFNPDYRRSRYAKYAFRNAYENGIYISFFRKDGSCNVESRYDSAAINFINRIDSGYLFIFDQPDVVISIEKTEVTTGEKALSIIINDKCQNCSIMNSARLKMKTF